MFVKNWFWFWFFSIIEKSGNGVYCVYGVQKPLYAQDKSESKETALLLLFYISNSQWGLQHGANAQVTTAE